MAQTMIHIDLSDVIKAGGVAKAISVACTRYNVKPSEAVVALVHPEDIEAILCPDGFAEMARAVKDHKAFSDGKEWAKTVRRIRALAKGLEGVDLDELERK